MCTKSMYNKVYPGILPRKRSYFSMKCLRISYTVCKGLCSANGKKQKLTKTEQGMKRLPPATQPLSPVPIRLGFLEMALQINLAQTFHITNRVQTPTPLTSLPWPTWKLLPSLHLKSENDTRVNTRWDKGSFCNICLF